MARTSNTYPIGGKTDLYAFGAVSVLLAAWYWKRSKAQKFVREPGVVYPGDMKKVTPGEMFTVRLPPGSWKIVWPPERYLLPVANDMQPNHTDYVYVVADDVYDELPVEINFVNLASEQTATIAVIK